MRTIDVDLLVECLPKRKTLNCALHESQVRVFNGLLKEITEIINEQATVNKWTLCSERLPNKKGTYLVTTKCLTNYSPIYDNVFTCEFNYGEFHFQRWEDNSVIAWQPLPEPYEVQNESR